MSTPESPEDGHLSNPNPSPEKEKAPDKNKGGRPPFTGLGIGSMRQKGQKGTYLIALRMVFTTAKMSIDLSIGVAPFYRFPINRT